MDKYRNVSKTVEIPSYSQKAKKIPHKRGERRRSNA